MMTDGTGNGTGNQITCEVGYILIAEKCEVDVNQDRDRDGVPDAVDNCPMIPNPPQADCDVNQIGDMCDEEKQCGASVSGTIYYIDNDGNAQVLPHARLKVNGQGSYATADDLGQFILYNLEVGSHQLAVYMPIDDYSISSTGDVINVPLTYTTYTVDELDVGNALTFDIILGKKGSVGGTIQVENEDPFTFPRTPIGLYLEELPMTRVMSNNLGAFMFENIPEGDYTLHMVSPGFEHKTQPITVIGLTNSDTGILELATNETNTATTQEIVIMMRQAWDGVNAGDLLVNFIPVFPEFSMPRSIRVPTLNPNDIGTHFYTVQLEYEPHDVYNISVASAHILASDLYYTYPEDETHRRWRN